MKKSENKIIPEMGISIQAKDPLGLRFRERKVFGEVKDQKLSREIRENERKKTHAKLYKET